MRFYMFLSIIMLLIFNYTKSQNNSTEGFKIYETALNKYFESFNKDSLVEDSNKAFDTYYVINNDIVENIPKIIKVAEKNIKLKSVNVNDIRKEKITEVFKVIPARIKGGSFYITIIRYSVIKSTRKEMKLANIGGGEYFFKFNCQNGIFEFEKENYE